MEALQPLLTPTWPVVLVSLVIASLGVQVFKYYKKCHSFWRSRNIPGPEPTIFLGNSHEMMSTPFFLYDKQLIAKYGDLVGFYDRTIPMLLVNDADIVHDATVKQFQGFKNRRELSEHELVSNMLTAVNGNRWDRMRRLMRPAFTPGKIKPMSSLMLEPLSTLLEHMKNNKEIDLVKNLRKLALRVIVRCGFGADIPDGRESDIAVYHALKIIQIPKWKMFIALLCPMWFKRIINFTIFHDESVAYFHKLAKAIIDQRRAEPEKLKESRDFVGLMLEVAENEKDFLSETQLMANLLLLLIAGFETTSSLLMNTFFLLARNPEAQERLHNVVRNIDVNDTHLEKLDPQEKTEILAHVDAVINETMRLYPPVVRTERFATQQVTLSNGVTVEKGTVLCFAIDSLHKNPKYWTDVNKFDPERFMPVKDEDDEATRAKKTHHPYAFMPFHMGPRNCIGDRFAWNEARLAVMAVAKNFKLKPSPKTSFPLDFSRSILTLTCSIDEVYIEVEPR